MEEDQSDEDLKCVLISKQTILMGPNLYLGLKQFYEHYEMSLSFYEWLKIIKHNWQLIKLALVGVITIPLMKSRNDDIWLYYFLYSIHFTRCEMMTLT